MRHNILYALYDDEEKLISSVKEANSNNFKIWDVFTPFPIHGIDPLLGLKESRLHYAGFIYGFIGLATAFIFMTWAFTESWPTIFGGKPYFSFPAFVPIMFELTVLFSSVGMVVTFYQLNNMGFGVDKPTLDDRITDDRFCIAFDTSSHTESELDAIKSYLNGSGAEVVNEKTI